MTSSTHLFELDVSALGELCYWLEARTIVQLWLCGSSRLNTMLSMKGAVRNWEFTLKSYLPVFFPSFGGRLRHLASFSVLAEEPNYLLSVPDIDWTLLPPTLTKIKAEFDNDAETLLKALQTDSSLFPLLQSLSLSAKCFPFSTLETITKAFPCLETLEIVYDNHILQPSLLPRSLTHLTITTLHVEKEGIVPLSDDDEEEAVEVQEESEEQEEEEVAINTLKNGKRPRAPLPVAEWPPGLTYLVVKHSRLANGDCSWLLTVPRGLRHLELTCLDGSSRRYMENVPWANFPPKLETLVLDVRLAAAEHIELLPRSLTRMNIMATQNGVADRDSEAQHEAAKKMLAVIPPGVRHCLLRGLPICVDSAPILPRNLRGFMTVMELAALPLLPETTTELDLDYLEMNLNNGGHYELTSEELNWRAILPCFNCLTTLHLTNMIEPQVLCNLPPALTSFNGGVWTKEPLPHDFFDRFPKSLQSLSLNWHFAVGTEPYAPKLTATQTSDICSSFLPPTLTDLSLTELQLNDETTWFATLPSSLLHLHLILEGQGGMHDKYDSILTCEHIMDLAQACPNLRSLVVDIPIPAYPYARYFPLLPRRLLSFEIISDRCVLVDTITTDEDFVFLPVGLLSLELPVVPKVGPDCVNHVPKHLSYFTIGNTTPKWWENRP